MSRLFLGTCAALALLISLNAPQASAQFRGRSRSDGESRGGGDPAAFLKQLDKNGNGTIDPDEVNSRMKKMIDGMAQRANLDPSKPMPVDKLIEAMKAGPNAPSDSADKTMKPEESSGTTPAASGKTHAVAGFGGDDKTPKAAGFGTPLAGTTSSQKTYSREVTDYVDRMLRDYDTNKDNVLDTDEMKNVRWQSDPKESDLNKDGKLDKHELLERIAKRSAGNSSNSGDRRGGPGGPPSAPVSAEAVELAKFKDFAKGYIKQRDLDTSGMLERAKGEWDEVSSENKKADSNGDGVITVDELAFKLASYGKSDSGPPKTASSGGPPSGSPPPNFGPSRPGFDPSRSPGSSAKVSSGPRKTYRPLSPSERLPKNLPDWFLRSDENEDGQVSMAEYAALWSESKAAEFAGYDLDGDGFVTAKECLKKAEKK